MLRERPLGFVGVTGLDVLGPQASKSVKEEEADRGRRFTTLRGTSGAK